MCVGGEGGTVHTLPKTKRFQWLRANRFLRVYQSRVPMSSLYRRNVPEFESLVRIRTSIRSGGSGDTSDRAEIITAAREKHHHG